MTPNQGLNSDADADADPDADAGTPASGTLPVTGGLWPANLRDRDQWLTWKCTDDGRKIPRSPFANRDHLDRYVNAHDPANQTDFNTAQEWAEMLPGHNLAYDIRNREDHPDESLVLLDYDDVRDPETGAVHSTVRDHIDRADSYAALSTSGTGIHILGRLPDGFREGVKTIESPLDIPDTDENDPPQPDTEFPAAEIEGYDSKRFVGLTGEHIESAPTELADITAFIEELCDDYATTAEGSPDPHREPALSREEAADIEQTDDMQDVYDAIEHTQPRDIRLRSTVTNDRPDSKDLNPSWTRSKSGTRLAQLGDGWVYRQGMHGLDALQVVALEEGLIRSESDYPEGKAFFAALDALRDRGAAIPHFVSPDAPNESVAAVDFGPGIDADAEETVLELAGKLRFASTRREYTCRCPGCETPLSPSGTHDEECSINNVDMQQIIDAYQTILTMLNETPQTRASLRTDVSNWGPVHSQVLGYLCDEKTIAPAGGDPDE